jgi:hypothetical protein
MLYQKKKWNKLHEQKLETNENYPHNKAIIGTASRCGHPRQSPTPGQATAQSYFS